MRENFTYINNEWMGGELQLKNPYEREVFAHISRMTTFGRGGWQGSVRELAERLYYPKSTIAKAVSNLIQKGLIQKSGQKYVALKTAPETQNQDTTPQTVQNMDSSVQNVDTKVHDMDNNVPNPDSLPPTTPITNNKKEAAFKSADNNGDKAEAEKEIINSFESFWTLYNPPAKWQDQKERCLFIWKKMPPLYRDLALEDLEEFPQRDPDGPVSYLQLFKPRTPFYLLDDEIDTFLGEGKDLAQVSVRNGSRYTTLKEAKLFGLNILRIVPAEATT